MRETVRYDAGNIQRLTRALMERVGPEVAVEAIAVAALGNMMIRLAMLTQ